MKGEISFYKISNSHGKQHGDTCLILRHEKAPLANLVHKLVIY